MAKSDINPAYVVARASKDNRRLLVNYEAMEFALMDIQKPATPPPSFEIEIEWQSNFNGPFGKVILVNEPRFLLEALLVQARFYTAFKFYQTN
jgi:hypothetical protein